MSFRNIDLSSGEILTRIGLELDKQMSAKILLVFMENSICTYL